ncbi:MAG: class I SAM-dependent RNA methyltransferase [Chlamydiota bacterium]|nr:class I SAM-dependent RNA methyltransferase [Chlamydiota bacterium]
MMDTASDKSNAVTAFHVGDEFVLRIDNVAFGGDGVGRIDDCVVFVRGALDTELVKVKVYEVKRSYIKADTLSVIEASPERVQPLCPVYGLCGGCQYQHVSYNKQLSLKESQVRDIIERIGHIKEFDMKPILPSPKPYHYRSRVEIHIRKIEGQLKAGYKSFHNRQLVDISACPIASAPINDAFKQFRSSPSEETITQNNVPSIYSLPVWVRYTRFWDSLQGVGMYHHGHDGRVTYEGSSIIQQSVEGKRFSMMHDSFFQVNLDMIGKMAETLTWMLDLKKNDFLLDCYSGVGLFSVFLAGLVRRCVGIESDKKASEQARVNAIENGLSNCEFIGKSVEKVLLHALDNLGERPNKVILDPARPGCTDKVLHALGHLRPERIAYVSCNPPTLARDLVYFCENGYVIDGIQPLDLFPQTKHCEVIVNLKNILPV